MTSRTVQLLHIEDDVMQQQLTAQQLTTLPHFAFAITYSDNEDGAVAEFERSRQEIVLLDYHLARGNGLSCLRKLRQLDPIVPIIALSGKATPEIAAELLKAGADNYLSKIDLQTETLTGCIQDALVRADAWRRHAPAGQPGAGAEAERHSRELFQTFATGAGLELFKRLDAYEAVLRQANLSLEQFQSVFESVCAELTVGRPADAPPLQRLLRPLLLEMIVRLWGDKFGTEDAGKPASWTAAS